MIIIIRDQNSLLFLLFWKILAEHLQVYSINQNVKHDLLIIGCGWYIIMINSFKNLRTLQSFIKLVNKILLYHYTFFSFFPLYNTNTYYNIIIIILTILNIDYITIIMWIRFRLANHYSWKLEVAIFDLLTSIIIRYYCGFFFTYYYIFHLLRVFTLFFSGHRDDSLRYNYTVLLL